MPKIPGWSTISGQNSKCRSMHTLMANIYQNTLCGGTEICLELQKTADEKTFFLMLSTLYFICSNTVNLYNDTFGV